MQPDVFDMHKLRQNSTPVGASPQTPLGSSQRSLTPLAAFKGGEGRGDGRVGTGERRGWEGGERRERERREGEERKGGRKKGMRRESSHF